MTLSMIFCLELHFYKHYFFGTYPNLLLFLLEDFTIDLILLELE